MCFDAVMMMTLKVQKVREEKGGSSKPLKHEQKEGCDDSEWD